MSSLMFMTAFYPYGQRRSNYFFQEQAGIFFVQSLAIWKKIIDKTFSVWIKWHQDERLLDRKRDTTSQAGRMTRNSPGNNHPEWTVGTGTIWHTTTMQDDDEQT